MTHDRRHGAPSPLQTYGPSLAVAVVAAGTLLAGPAIIQHLAYVQTRTQIVQASQRLRASGFLEQLNESTRDLALMVEPSVVHVSTRAIMRDPLGRDVPMTSSGSGWVYDERGHIVSNAHVVDGADEIEVQLHNGSLRTAEVVGMDLRTDIAVLKVAEGGLHPARRGSSDNVRQGEMVFAFGSPFDFRFSMSSGIVSGLGRSAGLTDIDYENFIQVDAAINPGNSGGPLTDIEGRVIGMNTAIATVRGSTTGGQGQFAGIGLAIPMSMIESVVDQIIEKGEVDKGFMGVSVAPISESMARSLAFEGRGVLIREVVPDGPAARAGLRPLDIITHVEGQVVSDEPQIPALVASRRPGDRINLRVWRGDMSRRMGEALEIAVVLDKLDPAIVAVGPARALTEFGIAELGTNPRTPAARLEGSPRRGVAVIRVTPDSPASRAMPPGSVIVAVNNQTVSTVDELYTRLARIAGSLRMPNVISPVATLTVVLPGGEVKSVLIRL